MSDVPDDTPCGACDKPVFAAGNVVLCSRCDSFQHLGCWSKAKRCGAVAKCKGKPVPVAVVKLQPPGPTAAEIADAVEVRTQDVLHPVVADLRSAMAHAEDVETIRKALAASGTEIKERFEALRREVETRTENLKKAIAGVEARIAAIPPPPLDRNDLARVAAEIKQSGDAAVKDTANGLDAKIAEVRHAVSSELHELLVAIEACRWDTAARRHPLPWDARTDDVLDPRSAGQSVT